MDKELFEKELLERLYKAGYRYIARDAGYSLYAYWYKPVKGDMYWATGGQPKQRSLSLVLFNDLYSQIEFEDEEPFDIIKALGIVDWSKVPKDTKVLVSRDGEFWTNRYFKEYRKNSAQPFVVYADGVTSWSAAYDGNIAKFEYCKLVTEGNDVPTF